MLAGGRLDDRGHVAVVHAELEHEPGDAGVDELRDERLELARLGRPPRPGGQQQLAAVQQPGHARAVGDVHPAHARVERVVAREHLGNAVRDRVEREDLAHGREPVVDDRRRPDDPFGSARLRDDLPSVGPLCLCHTGECQPRRRPGNLSGKHQKDPHEPHPTLHQRPRGRRRGAHRPGLQPGHRRAAARGGVRVGRRGGAGDRRGIRCTAGLARDRPDQARRRVLQAAPPARRAPGRARRDPHERARQGALGCRGRDLARHRERRVRRRARAPAQGRALRAGRPRRRRALAEAARRRGRRDHALQLPRHGSAVDGRLGDRVRQHGRAEALREGPERGDLPREAVPGGRPARRRAQRRARRQGRGRHDPRLPRGARRVVRRLDADREVDLRARLRERQARAGPRRREEPHGRHARRRPRGRSGCRGLGRVRLGRRALHGRVGARRGRRRRRRARRGGAQPHGRARHRRRHGCRERDGSADHPRAPRQGRLVRHRRNGRGRDGRRRRHDAGSSTATGSSSASR